MIRRLYDWTIHKAQSPHALYILAAVAFLESSIFPIPPDALMIPMIIARPSRAFLIATVALIASVAGGVAGYLIGWGLYETVGQSVLDFYGKADSYTYFTQTYNEWGAWAVLIAGVTPFPYKVITILSGATGLSFGVFMVASVIARGIRFFILASLLWKFGPAISNFIEKRLGLVFCVACGLLLGGFYMVRYL